MSLGLPRCSQEQLYARGVVAFDTTVAADPTSFAVQFAFVALDAQPSSGDWKSGAWLAGTPYTAWILVTGSTSPNAGGAPFTLTPGSYAVWLRVIGGANTPARQIDRLYVS